MTREENIAKLAQLRSDAEALVKDYNDAIQNGKYEDATKAEKAMTEKVNEYTATVRDMCFEDCKNTDNPMLTAVTTLSGSRTSRRAMTRFPSALSWTKSVRLTCSSSTSIAAKSVPTRIGRISPRR